jgi:hypothetical protein
MDSFNNEVCEFDSTQITENFFLPFGCKEDTDCSKGVACWTWEGYKCT